MFLMNYLFDFTVKTGKFTGDRRTPAHPGVLFSSTNWLKLVPTAGTPEPGPFVAGTPFDPEPATFADLLDMDSGTLLIESTPGVGTGVPPIPDESNVGIRIGLDPDSPATPGLAAAPPIVQLTICFGKPNPARQPRSSPFYLPPGVVAVGNQIVQTTFTNTFSITPAVGPPTGAPTGADVLGNPTWFYAIGLARFRPDGSKHRTHRYEFAVGITVTSAAGVTHHYSHDPDMDIGL